jgi:RNA polymerase sigma-70 factor (ECF subfamily)
MGTGLRRRNLAAEAIWLGRLVASLLPGEPEALGLLALMLHTEARRDARRDAEGEFVPLDEQATALWDTAMTEEAEALLHRASKMNTIGRYQLEAAVQSAHAARRISGRTDWAAIVRMYDALLAITNSPVVAINRATAIAETDGAAAGLTALDALADDRRLADYQPYWAARANLLGQTGKVEAAEQAYDRAIGLEADPSVRWFLQKRRTETRR